MKKALCVVAALMMAASFAHAQTVDFGWYGLDNIYGMNGFYNFNTSGQSARSMGMGGLYYTMDNEGYSSYLNPAGMVYTQKALMSIGFLSSMDVHEGAPLHINTPDFYDPETDYDFVRNINDFDRERNQIDNGGAVAPFYYFDREWWVGLGFHKSYDLFSEYKMPKYLDGDRAVYTQHGSIDIVNAGIATRLIPQLSFGVNMNVYVRGYTADLYNATPYRDDYGDTLFTSGHYRDKSKFSGTNFDFGAILDMDMFRVALNISTSLTLTQEATITNEVIQQNGLPNGVIDRITATNKFPMCYGGGIAFTPNEQLTVGFDLTMKPFSKYKIDIDPQQNAYTDLTDYDPEWEDLTQFRFGAEYILDFTSFDIPLRAGFQNIPGVMKAETFYAHLDTSNGSVVHDSTVIGDQFNTNIFTIGTGLKLEKIWFDIAYQFGSSDTEQGFEIDKPLPATDDVFDYSNKYAYSRIYISASMLF